MKIAAFLLAALIPCIASANGGGYLYGTASNGSLGLFQPKNAGQIEMLTEDLRIDLHIEHGHVEVEYTLRNPGKAVTAEIGFPCKAAAALVIDENNKKREEGETTPPLRNFTPELDGQKLDWRTFRDKAGQKDFPTPKLRGPDGPYRQVPFWYVFKLDFADGQTRKLRVTYDTNYFGITGSISDDAETTAETLTYLFSTAAVWKGPIRTGKVVVKAVGVPADQVKFNLPKRFTRSGDSWTWEFKNFKPGLGDDLNVAVHPARAEFGRVLPDSKPADEDGGRGNGATFTRIGKSWELSHHDYTATATSELPPTKIAGEEEETTYAAQNVADGNPETAWVEGAKGSGVGESITLALRVPRKVAFVGIRNGYCKGEDDSLYLKNGRVAEFAVSVNGAAPFTAAIPDERLTRHLLRIPLPSGTGEVKTIKLTIQKVYPGSKFEDTAVSDIELIAPLEKAPKIQPAR